MPLHTLEADGVTWLHCPNPTERDLAQLQKKFHFHKLDIEDCLSEHERPKIEDYGNYLFFVFYFPSIDPKTGRLRKEELNVFLGPQFIVTLPEDDESRVTALWEAVKKSPKKL